MNGPSSLAFILAGALAWAPPAAAETPVPLPQLSPDQATLLRCSAVFAVVATEQDRGLAAARAYPPLQQRGREYFVQASAQLMDELPASRETVQALLEREAARLRAERAQAANPAAALDAAIQPCLMSLAASGL